MPRLERLDELVALLRGEEHHTCAELASALGVSVRTLARDLDVLRTRGYPIEGDAGRGGGVRLDRRWGIGRLHLSYEEVIDLLLSLAILEKLGSSLLLSNVTSVRRKLAQSFPEKQGAKIRDLRKRILIGGLASSTVLGGFDETATVAAKPLCEAFFERRPIKFSYTDVNGIKTRRTAQPHYLHLNWPVWYVLAWDELRDDVRCFRADRIRNASVGSPVFTLKPAKIFTDGFEEHIAAL